MSDGFFLFGNQEHGLSIDNERLHVWIDGVDIGKDLMRVIKCKDCKHAIVNENHPDKPLICCLTKMCGTTAPDWFCADGERRDDDGSNNNT